jgi:hypothetical protein
MTITPSPRQPAASGPGRVIAMVLLIGALLCATALFLLLAACGVFNLHGGAPPALVAGILVGYFVIAGGCVYGLVALARAGRAPRAASASTEEHGDLVSDPAAARVRWILVGSVVVSLGLWAFNFVTEFRNHADPRWRMVSAILWLVYQAPYLVAILWLDPVRYQSRRLSALIVAIAFSAVGGLVTIGSLLTFLRYGLASVLPQLARPAVAVLLELVVVVAAVMAWRERRRPQARTGLLLAAFAAVFVYDLVLRSITGWVYATLSR